MNRWINFPGENVDLIRRSLFLLALVMLPALMSAEPLQIGIVLEMHGEWRANGVPIKGLGQGLPAGAVINLPAGINVRPGDELLITIILLNNQSIPRTCHSSESCKNAQFTLPTSLNRPSPAWERLSAAVERLLSRDPERYVPAIARTGDPKSEKLKDSVLLLDNNNHLSIGPLFQQVERGNYSLVLVDFNPEGATRSPAVIPVAWTGGRFTSVSVSNLVPGVYGARLMPATGSAMNQAIGDDAWVLLSAPGTYDKDSAAYRSCLAATVGWQASPQGIKTFSRVCMDTIVAPPKDPAK